VYLNEFILLFYLREETREERSMELSISEELVCIVQSWGRLG
jgi:hypothetical protein